MPLTFTSIFYILLYISEKWNALSIFILELRSCCRWCGCHYNCCVGHAKQVQPNGVFALYPGERLVKTPSTKIRDDLRGKVYKVFLPLLLMEKCYDNVLFDHSPSIHNSLQSSLNMRSHRLTNHETSSKPKSPNLLSLRITRSLTNI